MKYFLDTEFIEGFHKPWFGKRRHFIDLISIGISCEDGRKLHLISSEWRYKDADGWVREKVIRPMYIDTVHGDMRNKCDEMNFHTLFFGLSNKIIAAEILQFFGCYPDSLFWRAPPGVEIYGYYADYDWVVFCSLFGRMIDLPKGFPMYCHDLKQTFDELQSQYVNDDLKKREGYPKQKNEHNALADADWDMALHKFLQSI